MQAGITDRFLAENSVETIFISGCGAIGRIGGRAPIDEAAFFDWAENKGVK